MEFPDLDPHTRAYMVSELDKDLLGRGRLYFCPRLSERGKVEYHALLRVALARHGPEWLAERLREGGRLNPVEWRPDGTAARVPDLAAVQLAEGEFNRYYIRALCKRTLVAGRGSVVVHRAKAVKEPRAGSEAKVGQAIDARALLLDLRVHGGEEVPLLGIPGGPNSGLSVRMP